MVRAGWKGVRAAAGLALLFVSAACAKLADERQQISVISPKDKKGKPASEKLLRDDNNGDDWAAYGQSYGEQHYSPLAEINTGNVARLGLAWSYDLPPGNPMSGPIEVDDTLYTATGYSIVRAFDAATGKLLWSYDPKAAEASGFKLRMGWGIRGLAWWNGKIIVGTQDGRLIAIDAKAGTPVWSTMTVSKDDFRFISGAPRVFDGKVIIGHGGADSSNIRGYVTAYDAETGKQLWRFFTVPGEPAKGFEDETQAMAAKTWTGEWWKYGGGGNVWNSFAYDPETRTVFLGTGNGAPSNQKIRSPGGGDNLFLCSMIALDAETGKYKWHYQFNPGETWDYNASMDMQIADIRIHGKVRKVIMEAPKNGFFYVIDRLTGELISADELVPQSWARGIDVKTGRPIERPESRFPNGRQFYLFPGPNGAHTWLPSAVDRRTGWVFMPVASIGNLYDDRGIHLKDWQRPGGNQPAFGLNMGAIGGQRDGSQRFSELVALDPATRKTMWKVPTKGGWNGGVLATAGDLVFQAEGTGIFTAYDGKSGKALWRFNAQAPVLAPPISFRAGGRQYVTVISGLSTSAGINYDPAFGPINYHGQARRVLTFAIDGKATIPTKRPYRLVAPADDGYKPDPAREKRGEELFVHCLACHGGGAVSGGGAPDLRGSAVPLSVEAFAAIVRDGGLVPAGMPGFGEFSEADLADLRQYIRSRAAALRSGTSRLNTD